VTPRGLLERPELRTDCLGYYNVFQEICDTRNYNQAGIQPLQVSEIRGYLAIIGDESKEQVAKAVRLLLKMDKVYMTSYFEKQGQ